MWIYLSIIFWIVDWMPKKSVSSSEDRNTVIINSRLVNGDMLESVDIEFVSQEIIC